MAQRI
jgi:hypothetical protein